MEWYILISHLSFVIRHSSLKKKQKKIWNNTFSFVIRHWSFNGEWLMTNDEFLFHIFLLTLINGEWLMTNDEFIFHIFLLTLINGEWRMTNDERRMTKCFRAGHYHTKRCYLLRFLWFTASFLEESSFEAMPRWLDRKSSPFANGNLAHLNVEVLKKYEDGGI